MEGSVGTATMPQQPKPTANKYGYSFNPELDEYFRAFIKAAQEVDGLVADLGCGYGFATRKVLEKGRATVIANDLSEEHLKALRKSVADKGDQLERLHTVPGNSLDIDLEPGSIDVILAANWLHFLKPDDVRRAFQLFAKWLKPGGRLFVRTASTRLKGVSDLRGLIEKRKAAGDEFPGLVTRDQIDMPKELRDQVPEILHHMDPDILEREARRVGLIVEKCGFSHHDPELLPETERLDGQEFTGLIARKERLEDVIKAG